MRSFEYGQTSQRGVAESLGMTTCELKDILLS
jgi:hypothetical protein